MPENSSERFLLTAAAICFVADLSYVCSRFPIQPVEETLNELGCIGFTLLVWIVILIVANSDWPDTED